ncbi:MAG: DUF2254 family protein, partial [Nocardioidaceae bacterium]
GGAPGVRGVVGHHPFVPRVAVTVAFVLVLASVALFIRYISHVANLIRVATIIAAISEETRGLLERRCPPDLRPRVVAALPSRIGTIGVAG